MDDSQKLKKQCFLHTHWRISCGRKQHFLAEDSSFCCIQADLLQSNGFRLTFISKVWRKIIMCYLRTEVHILKVAAGDGEAPDGSRQILVLLHISLEPPQGTRLLRKGGFAQTHKSMLIEVRGSKFPFHILKSLQSVNLFS